MYSRPKLGLYKEVCVAWSVDRRPLSSIVSGASSYP